VDTIAPLIDDPKFVADPYEELQNTVLRSYGLSAHQRTVKWLDHPCLGSKKPWVLMDQLDTLKPSSVNKIQRFLFLHKMPNHIRDIVNSRDFQDLSALTEPCEEIWESQCPDLALPPTGLSRGCTPPPAAATADPPPSAGRSAPQPSLATATCPHPAHTGATTPIAGTTTIPASDHGPSSVRTPARIRKMSRPAVAALTALLAPLNPADPLPAIVLASARLCLSFQQKI
jgi:hypothetical protein